MSSLLSVAVSLAVAVPAANDDVAAITLDKDLLPYTPTSGVSGQLSSIGSDTLNNLMTLWAEGFAQVYPGIRVSVEGKGSSTAPPALIAGTSQLGPMSRAMKDKEIDDFEKAFGYAPTQIRVSIDALAVFVHKDNPLDRLTLAQVDAIFSKGRKLGQASDVRTWGDLGVGGEFANRPISLYGRNSASGTYSYFKDVALGKGDYKDTVKEQPGSASVVQSIAEDRFGIGYSGIGYQTSGVKTLRLAKKDGDAFGDTSQETVMAGKYPLSRALYVYVNKAPNEALDPMLLEFLKFVLSRQGQEIVVKDGYLPLPAKLAAAELAKLQ